MKSVKFVKNLLEVDFWFPYGVGFYAGNLMFPHTDRTGLLIVFSVFFVAAVNSLIVAVASDND